MGLHNFQRAYHPLMTEYGYGKSLVDKVFIYFIAENFKGEDPSWDHW